MHLNWQLIFPPILPVFTPTPANVEQAYGTAEMPLSTPTLDIAVPIWRATPFAQLNTVDVTSASWSSTARGLVRRYGLAYASNTYQTRHQLTGITLEGECQSATGALQPVPETNNLVPIPSGCGNASTLSLTQYTYYPDTIGGGSPTSSGLGTAFTASNVAPQNENQFVDIDGDGAAEILSSTDNGSYQTLSFSSTSAQTLSDPTGGRLGRSYQFNFTAVGTDGKTYAFGTHPAMRGDWLANGAVNWLTASGPQQWSVYTPSGATFIGTPSNLSCTWCDSGRAFDIDGNGLTDQSLNPATGGAAGSLTNLTQRAHDGSIAAFQLPTPQYFGFQPGDSSAFNHRWVADMDGDGLSDINRLDFWPTCETPPCMGQTGTAAITGGRWVVTTWLNRGDGSFGSYNQNPLGPVSVSTYYELYQDLDKPELGLVAPDVTAASRGADLNGDGFADFVTLTGDTVRVCLRLNAYLPEQQWKCLNTTLPSLDSSCPAIDDPNWSTLDTADIDGSGIPRVLVARYKSGATGCFDPTVYALAVAPGTSPSLGAAPADTYPGLLHTVSLLGGAQQTLNYQPVRALPNVNGTVPVSAWVVTGVSKTNGLPSTSSQSSQTSVSYTYQTPIYDPRDKMFVGFRSVREVHPGDAGAPGLARTTTFLTTACGPTVQASSCTSQVDYGWIRALRGLVASVDEKDTAGNELTTTVNQYYEHRLYVGLDGRVVRKLPLQQKKTYVWDPVNQAAGSSSPPFPFSNTGATYYENATAAASFGVSVSLPASGKATSVQQWDEDNLGNPVDSVDFGQPGVDSPIRSALHWSLASGDSTGWSYRNDQTSMGYTIDASGTTLAPPARSYTSTYDSFGRLSTKFATLANVPAPPTGFAAQAPPDASVNGAVCLAGCNPSSPGIHYDAYGNVTQNAGPSGRCTGVTYDSAFAQFAQITTTYTAGCGSANPLQTVRLFDRGFGQVTQQSAPSAPSATPRITRAKYDPFGRILEVDQPSGQLAGTTDSAPALKVIQYNDVGPIRQVHYQTVDGPPRGTATYQDHYQYIDGFGDTIAKLDQALALSGAVAGATLWLLSGVHTRYQNGRLRQKFTPLFVPDSPSTFSIDTYVAYVYPSAVSTYDGEGRPLTQTDFNGFPSAYSYQFNLSNAAKAVTVLDPEQNPAAGGSHQGSFTTIFSDGHGRVIESDQHLNAVSAGSGDLLTQTSYTATGERETILQTYPTGSYERTMQYDTFGRMVSQSEPNVGTWQYAYNDAGDLVESVDARGCGEVVYHDGLGRVTAHDYSPCDTSQPAYSLPNLTTGDGTEAFYTYDPYGALATEADRAQRSTYKYDPRGRMTLQQTQLAIPGSSDVLSQRYAPRVFTKGFLSYSQANRLLVSTTGTDLPDLAVNGSSLVTSSYLIQGGLSSVTSSYGPLLVSQFADPSGRVAEQLFGDASNTLASFGYDANEALSTYTLERSVGPNGGRWATYTQNPSSSGAENTYESVLTQEVVTRDMVGNPVAIDQSLESVSTGPFSSTILGIVPSEWPSGAAPAMTRAFSYGDDYRLQNTATTYAGYNGSDYTGPADSFVSPYKASDGALYPTSGAVSTGNRVLAQQYGYDWRGNLAFSTDDANVFPDRSLGTVVNGTADRVSSAAFGAGHGTGTGSLTTTYDAAGNLVGVSVQGGPQYAYEWNEVGRLASASRTGPGGNEIQQDYSYDVSGQRVLTTNRGAAADHSDLHTVQVFDSLVLKNAAFPDAGGHDYEDDDMTAQLYLRAGGQLLGHAFYAETSLPSASAGKVHVFMTLGDHLGSTAFVIDHDTGELVEAMTYLPYGGVESDYRPSRWNSFREDVRYTSHWDNAEVGLVYMNARYYSPQLGRFISPDPQTIHGAAGDLNPYAYAKGSPYRYIDSSGLAGCDPTFSSCPDPSSFTPPAASTSPASAPPPPPQGPFIGNNNPDDGPSISAPSGFDPSTNTHDPTIDTRPADDRFVATVAAVSVALDPELAFEEGPAAEGVASIATPYGAAVQSMSEAAIAARAEVQGGATLWRMGTTGVSEAGEAQFWALEHPFSPGFAGRYGIPAANVANANFLESAVLGADVPFVTRIAPGIGGNVGGGIEVVLPSGGATLQGFISF